MKNRRVTMRKVLILIGILILAQPAMAWDFTKHSIPLDDILSGGPPRDGIPALLDPQFISAKEAADSLKPGDKVIGVAMGGEARAYPVRILNYHELANDRIGDTPLLVSW